MAVTFTVGGQGASFGGLSTLIVTTNAAEQPAAIGAVQINAAAVFQGQTAIATITQTNVLTAAQVAAAGGEAGDKKREWAGAFSGDMVLTVGSCVRVERHSGTLTIELDQPVSDLVSGTANIQGGTVNIISTTSSCVAGLQPGQTQTFGMQSTPMIGPPSSLAFSQTESRAAVDGSGTVTSTDSVNGALTGDTIVGALIETLRFDPSNGNPTVRGTATSPVTLTPR